MDRFRQMTLFKTIVESGSITKAAERLDLSKSVLSQHLKQLESELKTILLKRTTRKQSLTQAGESFYQHCCQMDTIANLAWEEVHKQQTEPSGRITMTAPHALMDSIVIPALSNAFSGYPAVSLNLIGSDEQLDLMTHNIDLAIRVGQSRDSSYRQKKIGEIRDVLCKGLVKNVSLKNAPYVANHWQGKNISHVLTSDSDGEKIKLAFIASHHTNNLHQTASLIASGMGVGLVPDVILKNRTDLIPVMEGYTLRSSPVFALHPFQTSVPLSVSMAIDAVTAQLNHTH